MALTFQNPVWPGYFADPFILAWQGVYYAYGTGESLERTPAGEPRAFKILVSADLVNWQPSGAALAIDVSAPAHVYWAPEVAAYQGRFYLFYSSAPEGQDERHRLQIAVADSPLGPFRTQGPALPETEGFCIDAHPFRDPKSGDWYLFFAKDFFQERVGTGLAVAPLKGDFAGIAEKPRAILQANADWQIYERNRTLYGQTWPAWHTVEGPCVVTHGGRYYCFYSGGNWQTHDYGVSYAVADHPLGPWEHAPESGPVVLRQRPPDVLGPGHNSHVIAPDGVTELLVYHAWDRHRRARRMCLDTLEWTAAGPRCLGPTTSPQSLRAATAAGAP